MNLPHPARALGRLFWKSLLAFWLVLLVAGLTVGSLVWLHRPDDEAGGAGLLGGPRVEFMLQTAQSVLATSGEPALAALAADWEARSPLGLRVVDAQGRERYGRRLDPRQLERARALQAEGRIARLARGADGRALLLFVVDQGPSVGAPPIPGTRERGARRYPLHLPPPPPWLLLAIGLLASLGFSALLAWYVAAPIRHLRRAFEELAAGRLEARVGPRIGRRRDELADLGADFDRMAARLQALLEAQRRLFHDVSHELRSPLARLQAAVGLARQDPARLPETLERVERETARIDAMVGEVLTLARLGSGLAQSRGEALDLTELLGEIAADAGFEAEAGGRTVALAAEPGLLVHGQPELLGRALENIVRNAVRYSPPGGRTAIHAARIDSTDGPRARITVSDRGPGVAPDELEAIFQPFYRARASRTGEGSGLGLAIAQRAVAAHGGTLSARNRTAGGLEVTLELPLAGAAGDPAAARTTRAS